MKIDIKNHLKILGHKVEDRVTGLSGVASSVCFDLYGCIQVAVTPLVSKDGKLDSGHWLDISRLKITTRKPVMELPNYEWGIQAEGRQGCAEKPASKF